MSAKGSWHNLPSGLNDNFEMEITRSEFGTLGTYNDQSGNPVSLLIWDYESPDHEFEYPIVWPCGKGWTIKEQGRIVQHPKRDKFINTGIMGRLITRVIDNLKVEVDELGETWESDLWVGLKFLMQREKLAYPGAEQRGMPAEVERLMPAKFLGDVKGRLDRDGRYLAASSSRTQSNAPRTAPLPTDAMLLPTDAMPLPTDAVAIPTKGLLYTKLVGLARNNSISTHDRFTTVALNLAELTDDEHGALLSQVLDAGPDGFWAKVRAGKDSPF